MFKFSRRLTKIQHYYSLKREILGSHMISDQSLLLSTNVLNDERKAGHILGAFDDLPLPNLLALRMEDGRCFTICLPILV